MTSDPHDSPVPISAEGVYQVPAAAYHADPVEGGSLSSTGARKLLQRGGPAKYRYALDHPGEDISDAFDFGRAAHQVVLGDYENHVAVIPGTTNAAGNSEWRTNAAKEKVAEAREAGLTPIKPEQWAKVQEMATAIRNHRTAAGLLQSAGGKPEQTIVWRDSLTGVWCRARIDWFRTPVEGRRLIVTDYKTTPSADEESFGKSAADYGYFVQAAFYLEGVRALGLDTDPAFLFVAQEKSAPYLVNVGQLDETALVLGRNLVRNALTIYAECTRTGHWPDYGDDVKTFTLPGWFLAQYGEG